MIEEAAEFAREAHRGMFRKDVYKRQVFEHVMVLDDTAPTVDEDYTLNSNFLTITVSDSLSGVNYDELYGRDEDGERVEPTSIDQETGTVVFPMSGNTITVHIEDFVGNAAEPSYSIRIEGLEEDLSLIHI